MIRKLLTACVVGLILASAVIVLFSAIWFLIWEMPDKIIIFTILRIATLMWVVGFIGYLINGE